MTFNKLLKSNISVFKSNRTVITVFQGTNLNRSGYVRRGKPPSRKTNTITTNKIYTIPYCCCTNIQQKTYKKQKKHTFFNTKYLLLK